MSYPSSRVDHTTLQLLLVDTSRLNSPKVERWILRKSYDNGSCRP